MPPNSLQILDFYHAKEQGLNKIPT